MLGADLIGFQVNKWLLYKFKLMFQRPIHMVVTSFKHALEFWDVSRLPLALTKMRVL
jgi:hypothetical protein